MNSIAAIVVTYNRKELLLKCISHLLRQKKAKCDIIIVDNASTDGTSIALEGYIKEGKIVYFNTEENIGGAGGFQFGIKKAYDLGYQYYWLMDDDTYVDEEALASLLLLDKKLNGKYGFLSSVVYWKDRALCIMNRQHVDLTHRVSCIPQKETKIIMATFVSFFTKRKVVEKVGLPIKEFFIWADDLEYSRRISKRYPCYLAPDSKVVHYMDNNCKVGIELDSLDRLWRYKYLYRNEAYVYRREGVKGKLFYVARVFLHLKRVILYSRSDKFKRLGVIVNSVKKGLKFKPPIEYV